MKGTRITRYLFIYIYRSRTKAANTTTHYQPISFHCARRIPPEDTERGQEWKGKGERKGNRKWTGKGGRKGVEESNVQRNGG